MRKKVIKSNIVRVTEYGGVITDNRIICYVNKDDIINVNCNVGLVRTISPTLICGNIATVDGDIISINNNNQADYVDSIAKANTEDVKNVLLKMKQHIAEKHKVLTIEIEKCDELHIEFEGLIVLLNKSVSKIVGNSLLSTGKVDTVYGNLVIANGLF